MFLVVLLDVARVFWVVGRVFWMVASVFWVVAMVFWMVAWVMLDGQGFWMNGVIARWLLVCSGCC